MAGCHDAVFGHHYRARLVGVEASQCGNGRERVVPGDPAASYLVRKLTGIGMCEGSQMPKGNGALPAAEVAKVVGWICAGALED